MNIQEVVQDDRTLVQDIITDLAVVDNKETIETDQALVVADNKEIIETITIEILRKGTN